MTQTTLADGTVGELGPCKGPTCREGLIAWVKNPKTGITSPYNLKPDEKTGKKVSHFATCPDRQKFRGTHRTWV
jgi:hypothetical protein